MRVPHCSWGSGKIVWAIKIRVYRTITMKSGFWGLGFGTNHESPPVGSVPQIIAEVPPLTGHCLYRHIQAPSHCDSRQHVEGGWIPVGVGTDVGRNGAAADESVWLLCTVGVDRETFRSPGAGARADPGWCSRAGMLKPTEAMLAMQCKKRYQPCMAFIPGVQACPSMYFCYHTIHKLQLFV